MVAARPEGGETGRGARGKGYRAWSQRDLKKMGTDLSKYSPMLDLLAPYPYPYPELIGARERGRPYLTPRSAGPASSCLNCRFLCPNGPGRLARSSPPNSK